MATIPLWTPDNPAPIEVRALARLKSQEMRAAGKIPARVQEALADPLVWLQNHTKTYNEHWVEEGRPSPYEPFPKKPYFRPIFDLFQSRKVVCVEKSRDMMVSWACVAYFLWEIMRVPQRGVAFQAQKEKKVKQLVKYAKYLYDNQPDWIREAYPLTKPTGQQADLELNFANGSNILGLPGGADQVRSYHPWGYYNDETAFQAEAGECYNEALAAAQKLILNSSAGPGWYADFKRDVDNMVRD